ncbi:hypothetical protein ACFL1Q_01305 [Patescibacteria group bacterium]
MYKDIQPGFSPSENDIGMPPAANLEKLFYDIIKGKKVNLDYDDIQYLEDGKKYLESIFRGREIINHAKETNMVKGDRRDFMAHQITEQATFSYVSENNLNFDNIVNTAKKTVSVMLDKKKIYRIDIEKLEVTRQLFDHLSKSSSTLHYDPF